MKLCYRYRGTISESEVRCKIGGRGRERGGPETCGMGVRPWEEFYLRRRIDLFVCPVFGIRG